MVIANFHLDGIVLRPTKADPPLIIDADRMLSRAITPQGFQSVARRNPQVVQTCCAIQQSQFVQGALLDGRGQPTGTLLQPDSLRLPLGETPNHRGKVTRRVSNVKRPLLPEGASQDLLADPKRNFQVFDPLDFLAACPAVASEQRGKVTQHIPEAGEHLIRYYGFYSNKSRGLRGQAQVQPGAATVPTPTPSPKQARKRWAALISKTMRTA